MIEIKNSRALTTLLNDMLESYNTQEPDEDVLATIRDLYHQCKILQPVISRLVESDQDNDTLGTITLII